MTEPPHGPTSGTKPAARARHEPPPDPPRELEHDDDVCRRFTSDGVEWLARASGRGAGGTGSYGLGMVQAVHFFRAAEPATPLFEALLPAGRLAGLFEEELSALLRGARRVVQPEEAPPPPGRRGRRRSD